MKTAAIIAVMLLLAGGAFGYSIIAGPFSQEDALRAGSDPRFYNELGYKLAQDGRPLDAQAAFARAVELDPEHENARSNLATIAFQNGDYQTATEHLRVLVEQRPANAGYHFDLAQNLASQARYKDADLAKLREAAAEFERADALAPGFPHAAQNAAVVRNILAEFG